MRSVTTWVVAGALVVIALLAVIDVLREDSSNAPASGETKDVTTARRTEVAPAPPPIEEERAVAAELAAARISGTLYLTDGDCRLWTLFLPDLAWRPLDGEPSDECRFAVSSTGQPLIGKAAWSPAGDLGAAERGTDGARARILVLSEATDWTFSFEGSSPAFRPDGALTFVRGGELWGWVEAPCSPGELSVEFQSAETVERCERLLLARVALRRAFRRGYATVEDSALGEAVWLDSRTVVVLVHGRDAGHGVAVFVDERVRARHALFIAQVSALEASPRGTRVAYRADEGVLVFDRNLREVGFRAGVRAIAWPPDQRFTLEATDSSVYIVRPGEPFIQIPVATSDIGWVE